MAEQPTGSANPELSQLLPIDAIRIGASAAAPEEQLSDAGIDATAIVTAAQELLRR